MPGTAKIRPMEQFAIATAEATPSTVLPGLVGAFLALLPFVAAALAARHAGPRWWWVVAPIAGLVTAMVIGFALQILAGSSPRTILAMVQGYADLLLPF